MPTNTRVDQTYSETAGTEWASHRLTSTFLGVLIAFGPAAVAVVAGIALSHVYHKPRSLADQAVWLITLGVTSSTVLFVLDRQVRRLLPLAALLRLSLVFPDQAPSRFHTAIRTGSTKQLERRLEEARDGGPVGETLNEAAVRIVELASMLTAHDRFTRGHCERVRAYTDILGAEFHLNDEERNKLRWAAFLHDIGKLTVPTEILNKKGKPTKEEWAVIETHPLAGQKLLTPLFAWLGEFASAAWEHHERWDGTGYPLHKSGSEISLAGRIVAVADSFEVMTATRSYKKPMSAAAARIELQRCSGTHFDPDVVRAMLNVSIGRLRTVMGPLTWIAQLPFLSWTAPAASAPTALAAVGRTLVVASALHTVTPAVAVASTFTSPNHATVQASPSPAQMTAAPAHGEKVITSSPTTSPSTSKPVEDSTRRPTGTTTVKTPTSSSGRVTITLPSHVDQWGSTSVSTSVGAAPTTTTTTLQPTPTFTPTSTPPNPPPTTPASTATTTTTTTTTVAPVPPDRPSHHRHGKFHLVRR